MQLALAGIGAAGSIFAGLSGRSAAKKTQKLQVQADQFAKAHNEAEIKFRNKQRLRLAKQIKNTKEVTTEKTTGTNTRSSTTASSFDADAMLKAAEASGINPITFLRNGGMAAFIRTKTDEADTYGTTVTTTRKGHNAVAAANMALRDLDLHNPTPISHVPGAGEAIGQGISQFANAAGDIAARQDAQAFTAAQSEKHQAFQRELMMMSLGGVQRGGAIPGGRSFYVPGFSTSGSAVTRQTRGGLAGPFLPTAPTQGDRENTNPFPVGSGLQTHPKYVNAEQAESRWGDLLQELAGVVTFGADMWHNASRYLASSPTAGAIRNYFKDLGLSVSYDPKKKPERPLTFTVKPKAP